MNIGIFSKRSSGLILKMKQYLEQKNVNVRIYNSRDVHINESLFENDCYILKSKEMLYIYAGYFLEANHIPVIPYPELSYKHKNRIEAHVLLKKANLLAPHYYIGISNQLKKRINSEDLPLILKPIMGSGGHGIKLINTLEDLNSKSTDLIYLEKFIEGVHYNLCFIGDEICLLEKPPLIKDHEQSKEVPIFNEIHTIIEKWKNLFNGKLLFGHLDIVQEYTSKKIYIVDVGTFPEYKSWKKNQDPIPKICELILNQIQLEKDKYQEQRKL